LQELFFLKIAEQAGHGFTGRSNHLGNFLMRERQRELDITFASLMICCEFE
jgi:hypothetical protein